MNTRQVNGYFCTKDTRLGGLGATPVVSDPLSAITSVVGSVIGGGLSVWNTIEQQELVTKAAQAQASLQRQQAAQQAANAIYTMQQAQYQQQSSDKTRTFIIVAMILGGAGLLGYTIIKGMRK